MAGFVLTTGLSPQVYWDLKGDEVHAIIMEHNRRNKKGA